VNDRSEVQQAIDRLKKKKSRKMDDEEIKEVCSRLAETMAQAVKVSY